MKDFFTSLIALLLLSLVPSVLFAQSTECPISKYTPKDGVAHYIAKSGYSFKIERDNRIAKVQQKAVLGEHSWAWVPLTESGAIFSYVYQGGQEVLGSALIVSEEDAQTWTVVTRYNPYDMSDSRWIVASEVGGKFDCKVTQKDMSEMINSASSVQNVKSIRTANPKAIYAQLGLI